MDLKQLGKRMRDQGASVEAKSALLVRKVAVAVDTAVVLGTPVDTGRARSNWQVNMDSPARGTVPTLGPGAAAAAIAAGQAAIATHQPGQTIHITNNLAYIGKLNEGSSAQAPAGFVEEAVVAGAMTVRGARLLIKRGERVVAGDTGRIG